MQHLEVSCAVRPFFKSLSFKVLIPTNLYFVRAFYVLDSYHHTALKK